MQIMTKEESEKWHRGLDEWWDALDWNTKEAMRRLCAAVLDAKKRRGSA